MVLNADPAQRGKGAVSFCNQTCENTWPRCWSRLPFAISCVLGVMGRGYIPVISMQQGRIQGVTTSAINRRQLKQFES
jgi:hypothetical protein